MSFRVSSPVLWASQAKPSGELKDDESLQHGCSNSVQEILDRHLVVTDFASLDMIKNILSIDVPQVDIVSFSRSDEDGTAIRSLSHTLGAGLSCEVCQYPIDDDTAAAVEGLSKGNILALKRYLRVEPNETQAQTERTLGMVRKEVDIFCTLDGHPNIAKLYFIGWEPSTLIPALGLELAAFGTLDDFLTSADLDFGKHTITSMERIRITIDVAAGLQAVHACGYIHGDLKPSNILVQRHQKHKICCKLTDFAGAIRSGQVDRRGDAAPHGTPTWMAPEWLLGERISDWSKCDVYAYGLLMVSIWIDRCHCSGFSLLNFLSLENDFDREHLRTLERATGMRDTDAFGGLEILKQAENDFIQDLDSASISSFREIKALEDEHDGSPLNLALRLTEEQPEAALAYSLARRSLCKDPRARVSMVDILDLLDQATKDFGEIQGPIQLDSEERNVSDRSISLLFTATDIVLTWDHHLQDMLFEKMHRAISPIKEHWPKEGHDLEGPLPTDPSAMEQILRSYDDLLHPLNLENPIHLQLSESALDIAFCYWTGIGTALDEQEGLSWLSFAALIGNDLAMSLYAPLEASVDCYPSLELPRRIWQILSTLKGFRESYIYLSVQYAMDIEAIQIFLPVEDDAGDEPILQRVWPNNTDWQFPKLVNGACFTCMLPPLAALYPFLHSNQLPSLNSMSRWDSNTAGKLMWPRDRWREPEFAIQNCVVKTLLELDEWEWIARLFASFCEPSLLEMALSRLNTCGRRVNMTQLYLTVVGVPQHSSFDQSLNLRWLHGASLIGRQTAVIKLFLRYGLDPLDSTQVSAPLTTAIIVGRVVDVEIMLEELQTRKLCPGAFLTKQRDKQGPTIIHVCILHRQKAMLEYILNQDWCDPDIRNDDGSTGLHVAAVYKDPFWAKLLLHHGADLCLRRGDRSTPFDVALMHGNLAVASLLISPENMAFILGPHPESGFTCFGKLLSVAITAERSMVPIESFRFLAALGGVENIINHKNGTSALTTLFLTAGKQRKKHLFFDRQLLELMLSINRGPELLEYADPRTGFRPLHWAVFRCDVDAVHLLLDAGAEVNAEVANEKSAGLTALNIAMMRKKKEPKFVVNAGARELQAWRQSLDKITVLLRSRGAVSGTGVSVFEQLAADMPESITTSSVGDSRPAFSSHENIIYDNFGHISPWPREMRERRLRYTGDWPEKYVQDKWDLRVARTVSALIKVTFEKDSKRVLSAGWNVERTEDGKWYFIDHNTKSTTWDDPTPTHEFFELIRTQSTHMVRQHMIKRQYKASTKNHRGRTAISIAAENNREDIVVLLFEEDSELDLDSRDVDFGRTAEEWAEENGHDNIVLLLRQIALVQASVTGDISKMTELLEKKLDIDFRIGDVGSALHGAIMSKQMTSLNYLLTTEATPDLEAVALAVNLEESHYLERLQESKKYQLDFTDQRWPKLLQDLAGAGCVQVLQWFETAGANLALSSDQGSTALHAAAREGEEDCVHFLLSRRGVDVNQQDTIGRTASHLAAAQGHAHTLSILLEQANPAISDFSGRSLVHFAAISASVSTLR